MKLIIVSSFKAPWGLNRIGETELVLDGDFVHDETWGLGVTVYVIDTGIYIKHREFIGRARYGFTTFPNETNGYRTFPATNRKICFR